MGTTQPPGRQLQSPRPKVGGVYLYFYRCPAKYFMVDCTMRCKDTRLFLNAPNITVDVREVDDDDDEVMSPTMPAPKSPPAGASDIESHPQRTLVGEQPPPSNRNSHLRPDPEKQDGQRGQLRVSTLQSIPSHSQGTSERTLQPGRKCLNRPQTFLPHKQGLSGSRGYFTRNFIHGRHVDVQYLARTPSRSILPGRARTSICNRREFGGSP
jgi:hypothetical protein